MNFYWNAFSPLNLLIDAAILITFPLFLGWFLKRKGLPLLPVGIQSAWLLRAAIGLLLYVVLFRIGSGFALFLTGFMMIHLLWTLGTILLPLWTVAQAVVNRKVLLLVPAMSILAFKFYAEAIGPTQLEITDTTIPAPVLRFELRIAHITDLQTDGITDLHTRAASAISKFKPHAVVFTGDVLNHPNLIPEVQKYLHSIAEPGRSYFVTGNVDGLLDLEDFQKQTGFRLMDGKVDLLNAPQGRIAFLGLGLHDFDDSELLTKMEQDSMNADYRILFSHYPDSMFMASNRRIDILFAGHTHGGQVVIPGFGPPLTLSKVPRRLGAGGVHDFGNLKVVVSRGLGMEGHVAPRIRIFCPPQLMLVRLKPGI